MCVCVCVWQCVCVCVCNTNKYVRMNFRYITHKCGEFLVAHAHARARALSNTHTPSVRQTLCSHRHLQYLLPFWLPASKKEKRARDLKSQSSLRQNPFDKKEISGKQEKVQKKDFRAGTTTGHPLLSLLSPPTSIFLFFYFSIFIFWISMPARPLDAPSSVHSPLLLYSLEKQGARPGAQRSVARAERVACPMSCGSRALKVAVK